MAADKIIILPSEPLKKLNDETDLFGLLPKAKFVRSILTSQIIKDNNIKMVALYGHWGSGKTSLMNYLIENLKSECTTMLFEAWKLEKDTNLALSLLEQILETVIKGSKPKQALLETGRTLFTLSKNLLYSITINAPGFSIDPGKAAEKTQKELDESYDNKSYYAKVKEFKAEFQKLEKKLLKDGKRIIVFIDDLDRCEPENVLNLLSAVKLFFTYSSNIVYFCGIDKNAISAAIKSRYNNIINYEDYLEKIFDISLNMTEQLDLVNVLKRYFPKKNSEFLDEVSFFLYSINFLNPRLIIKTLNKYNLLKQYKMLDTEGNTIPDIVDKENYLTVILVLIMIILYEFYHSEYLTVFNYKVKFRGYVEATYIIPNHSNDYKNDTSNFLLKISERFPELTINTEMLTTTRAGRDNNFYSLINYFTPAIQGDYRLPNGNNDYISYIRQFDNGLSRILTNFCYYLESLRKKITDNPLLLKDFEAIKLIDLFRMTHDISN